MTFVLVMMNYLVNIINYAPLIDWEILNKIYVKLIFLSFGAFNLYILEDDEEKDNEQDGSKDEL